MQVPGPRAHRRPTGVLATKTARSRRTIPFLRMVADVITDGVQVAGVRVIPLHDLRRGCVSVLLGSGCRPEWRWTCRTLDDRDDDERLRARHPRREARGL